MPGASEIRVLVARGRRINLLLVREISRRLLLPEDFKDGAMAVRAKARPGFQSVRTNDMFPFPLSRTCEAGLPSKRPKRPRYGSRMSKELTGQDFRDPRACLRTHTTE